MREALSVVRFLLIMLWPMSVWAAGASLGSVLTTHSASDWAAFLMLSSISGLVALTNRIRKSMEADALERMGREFDPKNKMLIDWRAFTAFHMLGSYLAGLTTFLIAEHYDWDSYGEALAITLAAWLGAQFMDMIAGNFSDRITGAISAFTGKSPPPAT